jgi:hypothetical protein
VDKDQSVKSLTFRIHRSPWSSGLAATLSSMMAAPTVTTA